MTRTPLEPGAQPPPRPADRRPASRPARPDRAGDAITTTLTAIAQAIPPHLFAPWLPATLTALSTRAKPR
jgi:hypothetical protein